jgi:hypothetical protein
MKQRFWGHVAALRPRLVLTKFEEETTAHCPGYIATIAGNLGPEGETPQPAVFTVALGPALQQKRAVRVGDLLRGDAMPVPETLDDTPAQLYKVGVLRTISRSDPPPPDPPRTDSPLAPEAVLTAPRRPLDPHHLDTDGPCARCPYAVIACVVRLSDPRDYRRGAWRRIPACLGPETCPHFAPRPSDR